MPGARDRVRRPGGEQRSRLPCLCPSVAESSRMLFQRFSADQAGVPALPSHCTTACTEPLAERAGLFGGRSGVGRGQGNKYTSRWCRSRVRDVKNMKQGSGQMG